MRAIADRRAHEDVDQLVFAMSGYLGWWNHRRPQRVRAATRARRYASRAVGGSVASVREDLVEGWQVIERARGHMDLNAVMLPRLVYVAHGRLIHKQLGFGADAHLEIEATIDGCANTVQQVVARPGQYRLQPVLAETQLFDGASPCGQADSASARFRRAVWIGMTDSTLLCRPQRRCLSSRAPRRAGSGEARSGRYEVRRLGDGLPVVSSTRLAPCPAINQARSASVFGQAHCARRLRHAGLRTSL
jgi:hypothetical protein